MKFPNFNAFIIIFLYACSFALIVFLVTDWKIYGSNILNLEAL